MPDADHELDYLLSFDGYEYRFSDGHRVKIEAARAETSGGRPHGVKYSLTLHDPGGKCIYGRDNAHRVGRRTEFDHRHVYGRRRVVGYVYREVDRILGERGVSWR
jgi:hypothetical protein